VRPENKGGSVFGMDNLDWVEGVFPTPHGGVRVSHKRTADDLVESTVLAPDAVVLVR